MTTLAVVLRTTQEGNRAELPVLLLDYLLGGNEDKNLVSLEAHKGTTEGEVLWVLTCSLQDANGDLLLGQEGVDVFMKAISFNSAYFDLGYTPVGYTTLGESETSGDAVAKVLRQAAFHDVTSTQTHEGGTPQ